MVQNKQERARDEFFRAMAEFYDKDCMKRHESPTTRLIDQKNSKFMHAQALNQI